MAHFLLGYEEPSCGDLKPARGNGSSCSLIYASFNEPPEVREGVFFEYPV
jgi:hypothetical protein